MANYIEKIEFPKGIRDGSPITFILDNKEVLHGSFSYTLQGFFINIWTLFDKIGLKDPRFFFSKVVGEENVNTGLWPYVKGESNLIKVLNALKDFRADRIPKNKKVVISDDEKPFTLRVKSKRNITLNFKL